MDYEVISRSPLFGGIGREDLDLLLNCLNVRVKNYKKDDFIFLSGDTVTSVGLVLRGSVNVVYEDYLGNRTILSNVEESGLFGEAFSCVQTASLPISVVAATAAEVMFMDYKRIIETCSSSCLFHTRLIRNMLGILAEKNILLMQKIEHISKRTIREKIISYLSSQAMAGNSKRVEIPFNRQELSDYLSVDRSALSRELGLMQKEGLISFDKNVFDLAPGKSI